MMIRFLPVSTYLPQQNHREAPAMRALRWFWRFSQFYGEYTVRSPQERQKWLNQQQQQRP
ncbi:MAG: hypothetical protein AAFQ63_07775 [Cyanobacteria bacterium J06621_11]